MRPVLPSLTLAFLVLAIPATGADSGKVTGSYTLVGKSYVPRYVYAIAQKSIFDKSQEDVRILLCSDPIDDWDLANEKPGCSTTPHFSFVVSGDRTHSESLADGLKSFAGVNGAHLEVKARDSRGIEARFFTDGPIRLFDDSVEFDVSFSASILRVAEPVPPSDAERAAAAASPQAATYEAYMKAIGDESVEALRALLTVEGRKGWQGPEAKKQLEFLKKVLPGKPRYLRITGQGDIATLELETDAETGLVRMKKEGGAWKIIKERRTDRKSKSSWTIPF
jgi:hypothetical protein